MSLTRSAAALLAGVICTLAFVLTSCTEDSPSEPATINISIQHAPEQPSSGTLVTFAATSDAQLTDVYYEWDFGDGTPIQKNLLGNQYQHTYTDPGIYTVSVKVSEAESGTLMGEASTKVHVGSFQSSFAITVSSAGVAVGEEVQYTVHTLGTLIQEPRYHWDFGDGSAPLDVVGDSTVAHTFTTEGAFRTTCTVYDNVSGEKRWVGDIEINASDVPRPLFANYMKLTLHGKFAYHRVYSKLGELQADTVVIIDTISTRIFDVVSGSGEDLKWEGQHLKGRFSAKTSLVRKYLDVDVELSANGMNIVSLRIDGNIQTDNGYGQYRADTLALTAHDLPIAGSLSTAQATYRLDGAAFTSNIATLSSVTHNMRDGMFDDRYTFVEIVPGSSGYIEVELFRAW